MCHFITAICSAKTNITDINAVGENYGLTFVVCENEHVTKQILKSEKVSFEDNKNL